MSHNNLLQELETSNQQLKHEQSRTLTLGNELKAGSSAQRRVVEVILKLKQLYVIKLNFIRHRLYQFTLEMYDFIILQRKNQFSFNRYL